MIDSPGRSSFSASNKLHARSTSGPPAKHGVENSGEEHHHAENNSNKLGQHPGGDSEDDAAPMAPLMRRFSRSSLVSRQSSGRVTARPISPATESSISQDLADRDELETVVRSPIQRSLREEPTAKVDKTNAVITESTKPVVYEPAGLWRTLWLHPLTLLGFAVAYVCMAGALLALWRVSHSENGIKTSLSDNSYYWKYGPTAGKLSPTILVTILTFCSPRRRHGPLGTSRETL